MTFDPDLHRAISMRPAPLHAHPERVEQHIHTEELSPNGVSSVLATKAQPKAKLIATTSSYEAQDPQAEDHNPVARPAHASSVGDDVENQRLPSYTPESDPYHLSSCLKSPEQIEAIRANSSRKRGPASTLSCAPITQGKDAVQAKRLQGFYETQNENIERLLKPVDDHRREAKEEAGAEQLQFKIAVHGSFAANVVLAALQLYGAIASGSLSLFTTCADALFDPLSNITLILCNRAVNRVDGRKFPAGKARIETAGNICFCFLMCAVSFILIVVSARDIAEGSTTATTTFHLPSVIAVCVAFTTKLGLFFYCWALRNKYSQIRILWEDHRNDLFINGFGVLTSVGGSKLAWWIDPMGSIILSVLIATLWLRTAYSEFQLLIGVTADTQTLQLITYISMTHSPLIVSLDTVRAWHSGPRIVVEVDIVLHPDQSLRETHDIAEELQTKLESLPVVDRAYVHVDYETSHAPEHFLKKQL
ncbi:hypothetical protein AAFC00_003053 [Neodothiora populina]|uniref:Cation diffusion facilitator 1 n=1 Tax=Neodothiora populina TaxID=2781224 RepID=A0ABR3P9D4_9PEZI